MTPNTITEYKKRLGELIDKLESGYRTDDNEFYNDVHRECGFSYAKERIKDLINNTD
jgi:hypothetical protein